LVFQVDHSVLDRWWTGAFSASVAAGGRSGAVELIGGEFGKKSVRGPDITDEGNLYSFIDASEFGFECPHGVKLLGFFLRSLNVPSSLLKTITSCGLSGITARWPLIVR